MDSAGIYYFPVGAPVLLGFFVLLLLLVGVVAARLLRFASASMGLAPQTMLSVLLLSLLGSYINIPIGHWDERYISAPAQIMYFGIPYVIPMVHERPATTLAVNLGGAVIPTLLSLYLMAKNRLYRPGLVGIVPVSIACYLLATPEPGLGIAEPIFVPAMVTTFVALYLSRRYAGALAYICGSLGTLIGADIANIGKIPGLGAPVASIGGAGTFDGIFIISLLAVVYAGLFARPASRAY